MPPAEVLLERWLGGYVTAARSANAAIARTFVSQGSGALPVLCSASP
jgi:hypothetical protein